MLLKSISSSNRIVSFSHVVRSIVVLVCATLVVRPELSGQLNVRIGYNSALPQLTEINDALKSYMPMDQEIVKGFGNLSYMHGIQLGVRYRVGNYAFTLGWDKVSKKMTNLALNRQTEVFRERIYKADVANIHVGVEKYIGRLGYGAEVINSRLSLGRTVSNNTLSLVTDRDYHLKLKAIWTLYQGDFISFMVQPYYQFGLNDQDISLFARDLNSNAGVVMMPMRIWGVSFVFNNGRQH